MTKVDPAQNPSARAARVRLEDQIRIDAERAIQAESTVSDTARCLGIIREHLYRYLGTDARRHLPAAWLFLMPPKVMVRVLAEHLTPIGYMVAELPPENASTDDIAAILEAQRSTSAAVTTALEAIADGHITRGEGGEMRAKVREAIAALLTVDRMASDAMREGVIPVRRPALRQVGE